MLNMLVHHVGFERLISSEYMCWSGVYISDQHTNNNSKALYMQPQIHTACTRHYNVEQILL